MSETELKTLIQKVSTGATLDRGEIQLALNIMMSGLATQAQMGAFLMALRVRGETVEEITGAAELSPPIDLEAVYFAASDKVYVYLALQESLALAADFLPGVIDPPPVFSMVAHILIFLVAALTKKRTVHYAVLLLAIFSSVGSTVLGGAGIL